MASAAAGTRDDGIGNAKRRLYTRRFAVFCKAESRLLQNVSRPFARQKAAFHGAKRAYLERLESLENFRHRVTRYFPSSYAKTQKPGLFPSKAMLLHAGSPPEASTVIVCASLLTIFTTQAACAPYGNAAAHCHILIARNPTQAKKSSLFIVQLIWKCQNKTVILQAEINNKKKGVTA